MNVLLFASTWDTAGQQAALRQAFSRERPTWHVDQVARLVKRFAYPRQMGYSQATVRRLWAGADVVHLNLSLHAVRLVGAKFLGRPIVVHHHGSEYRDHRAAIDAQERGVTRVVSTLDLMGSPGVEWLPNVADLDGLAAMRQPRNMRVIRIAHSPTDRALKGTDAVLESVERLQDRGLPVELDLIEGVTWQECLARKAQADILVDQLHLGYGLSAIEAWGMGLPVVAGVADPAARARMVDTFGSLPFVEASPSTLTERLTALVDDARLRREWGERGRAHAERFHSERAVVERLDAIYGVAMQARVAA